MSADGRSNASTSANNTSANNIFRILSFMDDLGCNSFSADPNVSEKSKQIMRITGGTLQMMQTRSDEDFNTTYARPLLLAHEILIDQIQGLSSHRT